MESYITPSFEVFANHIYIIWIHLLPFIFKANLFNANNFQVNKITDGKLIYYPVIFQFDKSGEQIHDPSFRTENRGRIAFSVCYQNWGLGIVDPKNSRSTI